MSHRLRSAVIAIPLAAALLAAALLAAAPAEAGTTATSPLTCRGQGVDPAAQIKYRTEAVVKAPVSTIWQLQTNIEAWPAWQPAVTSSKRLDPGPLRPGSRFRWTTPVPATPSTPATALVVTSSVQQVDTGRCLRWTGPAIGDGLRIDRGVHVWTFTPVRDGVLVRTEETWTGEQVEADPAMSARYLATGLDVWMSDLKTTAEARPC